MTQSREWTIDVLGPLTLTYAVGSKPGRVLYRYAEGKIIIG